MKTEYGSKETEETLLDLFDMRIENADIRNQLKERERFENKKFSFFLSGLVFVLGGSILSCRFLFDEVLSSKTPVISLRVVTEILLIILGFIVGFYFLHKAMKPNNHRNSFDGYYLNLWNEVSKLYREILLHKDIPAGFGPSELEAYIESEVRETVREILTLQRLNTNPMRDTSAPSKAYLRILMAFAVRLNLMNTDRILVGMCDAESALYDQRADWFYGKLFEDPDFVISDSDG